MKQIKHLSINLWIIIILTFYVTITSVKCLIPKACVHNITAIGGSGICCPIPKGSKYPCGGHGRGTCQREYTQIESIPFYLIMDDRLNWPSRFFNRLCKCEAHYFGIACEECWYGWEGRFCNKRKLYIRHNIMSLSPRRRKMFVNVVTKMITTPTDYLILFEKDAIHSDPLWKPKFLDVDVQYLFTFLHRYASRATLFHDNKDCIQHQHLDNNHDTVGFLTWHRYYMLFWEKQLRKIAIRLYGWTDFTLPYWDWVDSTKCDVCVNSLLGAYGQWVGSTRLIDSKSPFYLWPEYCSPPTVGSNCYSCHAGWPNFKVLTRYYEATAFPTTDNLLFVLRKETFYLPQTTEDLGKCRGFHQALEGFRSIPGSNTSYSFMHNKVHNMVSGTFCRSATAANDPLFLVHHTQIDRIFQLWYEYNRPTPTAYPNHGVELGNCRECNMVGFIPTMKHVQMFVNTKQIGYTYDNFNFGKRGFRGERYMRCGPKYSV
uniref:SJCHGC06782 protein n=1 Tax=Schistosoma japonicum TaxID=6182 RepID=Q5DHS0_SCHJA|nr:SJCHGC06782 protein [Schistosoma japonicum]